MSAKPVPTALVSLFALVALALGGCAASVANEPASVPVSTVSYLAAPHTVDPPLMKPESPAVQPDSRQASAAPAPIVSHRRDDCGR